MTKIQFFFQKNLPNTMTKNILFPLKSINYIYFLKIMTKIVFLLKNSKYSFFPKIITKSLIYPFFKNCDKLFSSKKASCMNFLKIIPKICFFFINFSHKSFRCLLSKIFFDTYHNLNLQAHLC